MKSVQLGEICNISSGGTPRRGKDSFYGGSIPWVKIADISNANGTISITEECITKAGLKSIGNRLFPVGTILLAMYGSIGKVAVAATELSTNQAILGIRIKDTGFVDRRYLLRQLEQLRPHFESIANGVTQKNLSAKIVRETVIELPPLEQQKRIATILDKADELRAKRRTALEKLDQLLQSVFLEMFGDPVLNPKGWQVKPIREVGEVKGGLQLSPKRRKYPLEVPYLRVANVYRNKLELSEIKVMNVTQAELKRTKLQKGDVLVVEGHGNAEELGRSAVWDGSIDPCCHQNHLICVQFSHQLLVPEFASTYLNSEGGRRQLFRAGKTTSGLNTLSASNIRETEILVPPLEKQQEFLNIASSIECRKQKLKKMDSLLIDLFASLQQQSFDNTSTFSSESKLPTRQGTLNF